MPDLDRLGKYEIRSVLGKGAMGVVYLAFDPFIERPVAIKTIRTDSLDPELAVQFMARFKNEARAAGRLTHANIVGVYEYGEEGGIAYIVMEYVEGTGLREYLNRRTSFDFAQLVALMTQLLECAGVRASLRRRPPRHQAVEPDRHTNRAPQGRRLRRRPGRHVEPDSRRHGDRHAVLHVTGAVHGQRGRRALRRLQRRRRAATSC